MYQARRSQLVELSHVSDSVSEIKEDVQDLYRRLVSLGTRSCIFPLLCVALLCLADLSTPRTVSENHKEQQKANRVDIAKSSGTRRIDPVSLSNPFPSNPFVTSRVSPNDLANRSQRDEDVLFCYGSTLTPEVVFENPLQSGANVCVEVRPN